MRESNTSDSVNKIEIWQIRDKNQIVEANSQCQSQ